MSAAVYASAGGTRYHATEDCRALRSGQDLSDWDCWDDYCHHDHPQPRATRETTAIEALGAGKMPCRVCLPGQTPAWYRSSSEDDFGHEPFEYDGVDICQRCYTERSGLRDTVLWPCTTAVILGLAPREVVA